MIEARGVDRHLAIRIDNHEVGVVSRARSRPCVRRGRPAAPARRTSTRRAARAECRAVAAPVHTTGSDELQRRDAAPRREEVAVVDVLERRRRRRVIGGDQIDLPVVERVPQALAMLALANRRRAFQRRVAVGDIFGAERQVVRAGLDGDRNTRRARRLPIAGSASAEARCTMCTRAPVLRRRDRSADRSPPARRRAAGCQARSRSGADRRADRGSRSSAGHSACTSSGSPSPRQRSASPRAGPLR